MKTIIAGSREIEDYQHVLDAVRLSGFVITEVISGHARGVDTLGERWAKEHSTPVQLCHAAWGRYGRFAAGHLRNADMAQIADALIAVWDGKSPGTKNMIDQMIRRGKPTFVHYVRA